MSSHMTVSLLPRPPPILIKPVWLGGGYGNLVPILSGGMQLTASEISEGKQSWILRPWKSL